MYEDNGVEASQTPPVITEIERLYAERQKIEDERAAMNEALRERSERITADLSRAYEMLRKGLDLDVPGARPSDPREYVR